MIFEENNKQNKKTLDIVVEWIFLVKKKNLITF